MLKINAVAKRWPDGAVALDSVVFTAAPGTLTAIIGPSGAGKSTLLRVLAGLERYERGNIENPFGQAGLVFQEPSLWPHMTLLENVALPLRVLRGLSAASAAHRATEELFTWGLKDRVHAYPAELSGGQQRRGALARACILDPKVLCVDEVTGALDPETMATILQTLLEWKRKKGTLVLLVTHQLGFARRSADQVMFMDHGRIIEIGPSEVVLGSPREERTRQFIAAATAL